MARVTLIDNYDSFTFNLVHYLGELGANVTVWRNDAISVQDVMTSRPEAIVLSPGPCTPEDAGICCDLIRAAASTIPMFGVCLGHQAMGDVFGGTVVRAPLPVHGKTDTIFHHAQGMFRGINHPFQATRYHSLLVDQASLPDCLTVTAKTQDNLIMAMQHTTLPVYGVQFHPESIASEYGHLLIQNFLDLAMDWNHHHTPVFV
jgi:anthranilate synthase component 2